MVAQTQEWVASKSETRAAEERSGDDHENECKKRSRENKPARGYMAMAMAMW